MSIQSNPIEPDLLDLLEKRADAEGKTISELLKRFLDSSTFATEQTVNELLDLEYLVACKAEADPAVTLSAVRQSLSKIPDSMTADFIAERDKR